MKQIPRIIAVILLLVLYAFARPKDISNSEKTKLSSNFNFEKSILYYPKNLNPIFVRKVHPQYEKLSTWISSIGTSVAFIDYDDDNLLNDVVSIDPRFNRVFVSPLNNTGNRFLPFELEVKTLPMNEGVAPSGLLVNDFNEDGKEDILVMYFGRSPILFYKSDEGYDEAELILNETWNSTTGTIADFDSDGHPDIFIGNYFPNESILYNPNCTDKNQIMQHSMSHGDNGARNRIFLWSGIDKNGKAIFKEDKNWLKGLPLPNDWTLAVAAGDIDGDLVPDLYISNDFGPDKLLLNKSTKGKLLFKELKGQRTFTSLKSNIIGNDSFKGMGAEMYDINNDGLLDIFVSNIADDYALHESHFLFINNGDKKLIESGIAPFENKSEDLGMSRSSWGWDCKFGDFNNDMIPEAVQATGFVKGKTNRWPELQELATLNDELLADINFWPQLKPGDAISGNAHIPFFVKSESGKYFDLSKNIGIDENQITRAIAIADIDHDGKLDFVTGNQWEDSKLYHNKSKSFNSFLGLSLKFPLNSTNNSIKIDEKIEGPTKYAIGAIAKIKLKNGKELMRFVDGGNGHSGRNSPELHFGLGKNNNEIVSVDLTWRNSKGIIKKSKINLNNGWHTIYLPY
ncbi:CRTAC1 family protein [Flavobacterium ranwuense]|uniref:CRTAC1 family protein n=1 Tax=Flavobacterium ranwuense TaxID=2541725 RepID=A0ABY2DRM3_9FLAO|nr:CRTAC1 family protein [Flavobacterium ranwuense]TDE29425.1 CRTAC1 family protein [Flavobacterium ranwuense]